MRLPTLDAHGHIKATCLKKDLRGTGYVLAMTLSLEEAARAVHRNDDHIAWGIGCHPRFPKYQQAFHKQQFESLLEKTAIVGEIGLECDARTPMDLQLVNFRQILDIIARIPRLVSIHSFRTSNLLLSELKRRPIAVPVLHWWTGNAEETSQAVKLGCYFSIHSAVARQSKFHTRVPLDRILVESDHGFGDPPAAIPHRIGWVEHLVAQQYGIQVKTLREIIWHNFSEIINQTGIRTLLPAGMAAHLFGA